MPYRTLAVHILVRQQLKHDWRPCPVSAAAVAVWAALHSPWAPAADAVILETCFSASSAAASCSHLHRPDPEAEVGLSADCCLEHLDELASTPGVRPLD